MVVLLKGSKDIKRIKKLLADHDQPKKFDAKRFCGVLKTDEDALKIQLRLRDEWGIIGAIPFAAQAWCM